MTTRQITFMGQPRISVDQQSLSIPTKFDDGTEIDLLVSVTQLGDLVAYFAVLNDLLSDQGVTPDRGPKDDVHGPIRVHGLGFQAGTKPEDSMLVLDLAGCRLGFALDSERLVALADGVSRMARTLSADHRKPQ